MIKIEIHTDNAAFDDGNKGAEVARILRALAQHWEAWGTDKVTLRDVNGNTVGIAWEVE